MGILFGEWPPKQGCRMAIVGDIILLRCYIVGGMKKPSRKILALAIMGLLLFGFTMCCSGLHFPFFSPRGSLDGHMREDFGIALPASALVDNAYRVAARDPEEVFGIHMRPGRNWSVRQCNRSSIKCQRL